MKDEFNALFKTFLVYFISLVAGMGFLSLFMHIDIFSKVHIFYYSTLMNAVLAVIGVMGILFLLRFLKFKYIDITLNLIFSSSLLVGMAMFLFVTIAPLTIDRSYTIFMLSDMAENSGQLFTAQEIEDRFSDIYIYQYDSMEKRIDEQLSIGNIEEVESCYRISQKGENLVDLFRLVERFYPVEDKRIIYPDYSNEK